MKVLQDVNFPEAQILNVTPRRMLDFLESRGAAPDEFADL
jgi:putative hydrolase